MGRGDWIDDLGLAEIKAAVIKLAYDDYVRARMREIALLSRDIYIGDNVKDELRRANISEAAILRSTSRDCYIGTNIPKDQRPIEARLVMIRNAKRNVRNCREFFTSGRFDVFSDAIDGQALLDYAEAQLEKWVADEVTRIECYARNEYKAHSAQMKKKKGKKGR